MLYIYIYIYIIFYIYYKYIFHIKLYIIKFWHYKNGKKNYKLGDVKIEKQKFYQHQKPISKKKKKKKKKKKILMDIK